MSVDRNRLKDRFARKAERQLWGNPSRAPISPQLGSSLLTDGTVRVLC